MQKIATIAEDYQEGPAYGSRLMNIMQFSPTIDNVIPHKIDVEHMSNMSNMRIYE